MKLHWSCLAKSKIAYQHLKLVWPIKYQRVPQLHNLTASISIGNLLLRIMTKKISKKKDPEYAYHTVKVLDSIEDAYCEAKGDFNDLLYVIKLAAKASTPKGDDTIIETRSQPISIAYQHLPPIDIPPFSGKHADWKEFRDISRAMKVSKL